jgi:S-(hydroxymethyl)glutathione dehydrogenase/alcohol dehydrogenase
MTVAVFGVGGVGLNAIQGARLLNATRIIAVDVQDHKLEFAYRFGATDVINSRSQDPAKAISEMTGGGVDFAFDTFGGAITTEQMMASVRKGGTGVLVGLAPEGVTAGINMIDLVRNQKTLVGSYYGSASPHETFGKLLDFWRRGTLEVESLVTRTHELAEINEAYDALARGDDGRGILVFA